MNVDEGDIQVLIIALQNFNPPNGELKARAGMLQLRLEQNLQQLRQPQPPAQNGAEPAPAKHGYDGKPEPGRKEGVVMRSP